ncbi:MAG: DUF917 domain-containing protein [Desulfurococcales archaeon]|nr:DUF917 domain-containing protein [Desulfurococcales archaeon]
MFKLSSWEDAEALVLGASILGTGGGGDPREGLRMMERALKASGGVDVVGVEELHPESTVVSAYYVGTVSPTARPRKTPRIGDPVERAFSEMERMLEDRIGALVATEIGGGNTPVVFEIAARLGLPVVDGDLLGRAAPELHQCTAHIRGYGMSPSVIVSETGNIVVVKSYSDIDDYEAIARFVSVLAGRHAAVVDTPLRRRELEEVLVRDTISLSLNLGRSVFEARRRGEDPVKAAARVLDGWVIFRGIVDSYSWRDEGGFLIGESLVRGIGKWNGLSLRTWIKNEHIMAWAGESPIVMPPDLVTFLDPNGGPVLNSDMKEGDEVYVLAARAPEIWRTEKGLELFGPRHFGFDYDYVPVEKLVGRAGVPVERG